MNRDSQAKVLCVERCQSGYNLMRLNVSNLVCMYVVRQCLAYEMRTPVIVYVTMELVSLFSCRTGRTKPTGP